MKTSLSHPKTDIAFVLLAAGRSERFGSNKLLADFQGKPLWHWAAEAAENAGFEKLFLVCNPDSLLEPRKGWRRVINHDAGRGMGNSIAKGMNTCRHCSSAVVALADMPFVTAEHLQALIESECIAFTEYGTEGMGCPAAFPQSAFSKLRRLDGDRGASALKWKGAVALAPREALMASDVDTVEQLEELQFVANEQTA